MNDEGDRRAHLAAKGDFGQEAFVGGFPELQVGQVFMVDDDEQVEVGEVTADGIVDPVAARIAAEQDDLQDLAVAQAGSLSRRDRLGEGFAQDGHCMVQFAPLAGRQFPERLLHERESH
ncbi:hypothetical protein D3C77_463470 [compost metagenome]